MATGLEFKIVMNKFPSASAAVRRGVAKGLAASKMPILNEMKRRTPVDSGALRDSETVTSDAASLTLTAGGGDVDYALHVHNGTRFLQPRRFMTEAIGAQLPAVENAVIDAIESELR